jgi:serine/threonine protein kinase
MAGSEPKLRELFSKALECQTAEEQAAFLAQACQGDAESRAQVEELLQAHREAGSFLQEPSAGHGATVDVPPVQERPCTVIGPYKLLERIGEGGMGTVWMAQQTEPVKRLVAVKLIKAGMDSRQVIARFEAERQALALMDHPNIARVLDAGTTGAGRPYFVMDLVKGVPITRYCDEHHLTPRQRLELFIAICQAVQHAHQKGVIHRDLKPSNVLVALYDGKPVPKVIDFGVAKAAGQVLTDKTLVTGFGAVVGTPEYMSPEQATLDNQDVDTRSDVYSLGVLLYELLTGTTPLEHHRLKAVGLLEALRVIREEEAPTLSDRLSTTAELPAVAANRGTEPAALTRLVRGELDWIVMKALEKDRARRYPTANAFAADLQRYLADEPVLACPPSAAYRFRKFARRYRGTVLAGAVILVLLCGGVVGTTAGLIQADQAWRQQAEQRRIAEWERDEKERAREKAVAHLQTARRAMERMLARISKDGVAFEPRLEGIWRDLLQESLTFYQQLDQTQGDDPALQQELASAYHRLGVAYHRLGERGRALQMERQAIGILEGLSSKAPLSPDARRLLIGAYRRLGWVHSEAGRRDERVTAHERAFWHAERLAADFPTTREFQEELANHCINLGYAWRPARPRDAEALFHRANDLLTKWRGNRHDLGKAHLALGELQAGEERLPQAEAALRQAVTLFQEEVEGAPHLWQSWDLLSSARLHLGRVLAVKGRAAEAEQVLREAVGVWEKQAAAFPRVPHYRDDLIGGYAELAQLLAGVGKADEARGVLRKLTPLAPEGAAACNHLAWLLATCAEPSLRDPARAVTLARKAVDLVPQFASHWRTLGAAHYRAGDPEGALAALRRSMELRDGGDGFDWFLLTMAHGRLGAKDAARQWYDKAVAWMDTHRPKDQELVRFRGEAREALNEGTQGGPLGGTGKGNPDRR